MPALKARGFSLLELMITVAVVALLASIAYPSYREQVRRSGRAEAQMELAEQAQALERCFTRFSAYNNSACSAYASLTGSGIYSENRKYLVTGTSSVITAATFTLTATPQGGQAGDGCGNFTLTEANVRGVSGSAGVAACWR